jgi:diaminohydroxyphosphoribosylaminopyrimidine deaminase/5-amino-6-(5-phosphoribosylamino)uracil reductase
MIGQDEKNMQMALRLAQRGVGSVEPNPAVGCVITKANQVAGKGWHKEFGGPHAEINALEDCKTLGINPQGGIMYVTLEPCCHKDKTAPCTDAIIAAGLVKVVVATTDPSEHCGGKGVEQLRDAGIEVQIGVCENEAKLLNAPFLKFAKTGKSWVILKWAQSIDGQVAWTEQSDGRRWISSEQSKKDAQNLRRRAGAILVGINTVLADDPLLTIRPSKGRKPTRVVLDNNLRMPLDSKLLGTVKEAPVLIFSRAEAVHAKTQMVDAITQKGAEILAYPDMQGESNLYFLLDELSKRGVAQLLVEGGPKVITSFLRENLVDEVCVYIAPKILGRHGSVGISEPMKELTESFDLCQVDIKRFGDDVRLSGLSKKAIDEISISL